MDGCFGTDCHIPNHHADLFIQPLLQMIFSSAYSKMIRLAGAICYGAAREAMRAWSG